MVRRLKPLKEGLANLIMGRGWEPLHPSLFRTLRLMGRLAVAASGLFFFTFGILLMKDTAGLVASLHSDLFTHIEGNPGRALGFGWIAAYAVLSGSPIAATAVGFLHVGALGPLASYSMIMGSRLGASMLTLVVGLIAWLWRRQDRFKSLAVGVLAFLVTYLIYAPGILLGYILIYSGALDFLTFRAPAPVLEFIQGIFQPLVGGFLAALPETLRWTGFFPAFAAIYAGFYLFDLAFYREEVEEIKRSRIHDFLKNPLFAFAMGAAVTLVAESVSISLGLLVPLFIRGYLDTDEVIPYIMGANITTFIDTLVAALILDNPVAVNIVLVEIISIAVVSAVALWFYPTFHDMVRKIFDLTMDSNVALLSFAVGLVAAPVLIIFL
jgi:Na+/phosphate symporter